MSFWDKLGDAAGDVLGEAWGEFKDRAVDIIVPDAPRKGTDVSVAKRFNEWLRGLTGGVGKEAGKSLVPYILLGIVVIALVLYFTRR